VTFVTFPAVIPAVTNNVTGQATARPAVQTTITAQSATSIVLKLARPPQPAADVTAKETVCTDVSTALQVTTVTQVSVC